MTKPTKVLNAAEAARSLGVSVKALRLYEERGLLVPERSATGWRLYDPTQMARAREIVELRALGLGLGEIGPLLDRDAAGIEHILAAHERALEARQQSLRHAIDKVKRRRAGLPACQKGGLCVAFDLSWPWNGERFELRSIKPLNFIVGPLGSGKTRLAKKIAEELSGAVFIGLDRFGEGSAHSDAFEILSHALERHAGGPLVIDVPEHGLDGAAQQALMSQLRGRATAEAPIFLLTRSNAMLDLDNAHSDESIILCPANHDAPMIVPPVPSAPGYESVATCLGSPDARARTEGIVAWRPTTSLVQSEATMRAQAAAR